MSVWIRVAAMGPAFEKVRDAIDQHIGHEDEAYPATWTQTDAPVAWTGRVIERSYKRWKPASRPVLRVAADRALVERLERALERVAPGVGRDMIAEHRRQDDDMLVVVDVSA